MEAIRQDLAHPPLIYLLERGWLHLFGQTDNAAKALPLVINIPTIVLFTLLASRVTQRWRLAGFLFCGVYLRVGGVTTLVRMYGLGVLWSVAAILLWEAWRKNLAPHDWFLGYGNSTPGLDVWDYSGSHGAGLAVHWAARNASLYGPRGRLDFRQSARVGPGATHLYRLLSEKCNGSSWRSDVGIWEPRRLRKPFSR